MFIIYKATCKTTGKVYIGFTGSYLSTRKAAHKYAASKRRNKNKFHNAINKYGFEDFVWDTVFMSEDREYCLNFAEVSIINSYDSINNGYNTSFGGVAGARLSGNLNGMYGKTHTDEVKVAQGERAKSQFKGKSYEALYGPEKALQLRSARSEATTALRASNPLHGAKNPNFDKTVYSFKSNKDEVFTGTQYEFYTTYALKKGGVSQLVNGKLAHYKGWTLLRSSFRC